MNKDNAAKIAEARKNPPCHCEHGFTCDRENGRECGLPIMECMEKHYFHNCEHTFDGPPVETDVMGCRGSSATCSKCGMVAVFHDMEVGP